MTLVAPYVPGILSGARPYQLGVVVRDLDEGMAVYEKIFGIPRWRVMLTDYRAWFRGEIGQVANRNAFARLGDLCLEMVEPCIGQSTAGDWLDRKGEGIFHVGYIVDGAPVAPDGTEILFQTVDAQFDGKPAIIHLDTEATLGYVVELAERSLCENLLRWIDEAPDAG